MDSTSKQALDELFADSKHRAQVAQERKNVEADAQAEFLNKFLAVSKSIIVPACQEFSDYINANGWRSRLEVKEEAFSRSIGSSRYADTYKPAEVRISFLYDNENYGRRGVNDVPYFAFSCNKDKRLVDTRSSTIGSGHGGSSGSGPSFTLHDLTVETVHASLVDYFKKLVSDSRPYDQR